MRDMRYRIPAQTTDTTLTIRPAEPQLHGVAWMGGTSAALFAHPDPSNHLAFMDSIQADLGLVVITPGNGYYSSFLRIQKWIDEGRPTEGMKDWAYDLCLDLSNAEKRFVAFMFRVGASMREAGFDTDTPEWQQGIIDMAHAIGQRLAPLPGFLGVAWDGEYSGPGDLYIQRGFASKADFWDWVMNPARPGGFFSTVNQYNPAAVFFAQPNKTYAGDYTDASHAVWNNHENWKNDQGSTDFKRKIDGLYANGRGRIIGISCDQGDLDWHVALNPEEHTWMPSGGWVRYDGMASHATYALLHNPQYISFTNFGWNDLGACPVCDRTQSEFDELKRGFIAGMGYKLRQVPYHAGVVARWGDTTDPAGSHPDIATAENPGLGYMLDSGNQLWATNWSNSTQIIGINWGGHTASTTLPGYSFAVFALDQTGIIQLT